MANTIKTYGVDGLMEWHARIPVGNGAMHVDFTDGAITGYGVTPAEFTTKNPVVQAIIEKSDYFRQGKIFLLREVKDSTDVSKAEQVSSESEDALGDADATDKIVVSVSCNDEAKDYLVEHFGVLKSDMRTRAQINTAAAKHGVVFDWQVK